MMSLVPRMPLLVTLGLSLAALGSGCGGSGGSSEYTAGGAKVKVLHPPAGGSSSTGKAQGGYSLTTFEYDDTKWKPLTVLVDHDRLGVNGQDYGRLGAGDEAVIDARRADPTVTVNGTARSPTEGEKKKDDSADPLVKEARADTEAVLNGLLAGKYDDDRDFAPVARKVKGYESWSIDRQEIDRDSPRAVNFHGTLEGPRGEATFVAGMRKQRNGKWMIGYFSGPRFK